MSTTHSVPNYSRSALGACEEVLLGAGAELTSSPRSQRRLLFDQYHDRLERYPSVRTRRGRADEVRYLALRRRVGCANLAFGFRRALQEQLSVVNRDVANLAQEKAEVDQRLAQLYNDKQAAAVSADLRLTPPSLEGPLMRHARPLAAYGKVRPGQDSLTQPPDRCRVEQAAKRRADQHCRHRGVPQGSSRASLFLLEVAGAYPSPLAGGARRAQHDARAVPSWS